MYVLCPSFINFVKGKAAKLQDLSCRVDQLFHLLLGGRGPRTIDPKPNENGSGLLDGGAEVGSMDQVLFLRPRQRYGQP